MCRSVVLKRNDIISTQQAGFFFFSFFFFFFEKEKILEKRNVRSSVSRLVDRDQRDLTTTGQLTSLSHLI